jgi:Holliday junction DNA helicase RuvB
MEFGDFIGQQKVKENLKLLIDAALRGRQFPHIGLYGPAGSGKTTLAEIIAEALGAKLVYVNGSAVTSSVVFRGPIVRAVKESGKDQRFLIVVDECHALPKKVQDNLLSVLEEPAVLCTVVEKRTPLPNGKYIEKGQILREKLPNNVSFVFCTTDKAKLTDAMESRLHPLNLDEYSIPEKVKVVRMKFFKNNVTLEEDDYELVAGTSKSMRHLIKICDRLIDFAVGQNKVVLDTEDVERVLDILGIDEFGCDDTDRKYIEYVREHGPVSLSNIGRYLNVADAEVKEKIEPFLIRNDWVEITGRGRVLTRTAYKQLYGRAPQDEVDELMEVLLE